MFRIETRQALAYWVFPICSYVFPSSSILQMVKLPLNSRIPYRERRDRDRLSLACGRPARRGLGCHSGSFLGIKLTICVRSAFANRASSKSVTWRNCASICERVPRLISNPIIPHRAESCSCVSSCSIRNFRTKGPIMLRNFFIATAT